MIPRRTSCLACLPLLLATFLLATAAARAADVSYADQIKPLLAEKCWACHGALKQESGLRLDASQLIRQGGDSGPAIVAGQPQASLLLERVADKDPATRMPPAGEGEPLTAEQLTLLRDWIGQGAVAEDEPVPDAPQRHWAYQPPRTPDIPAVARTDWVRNPLDALLAAHHERLGLTPAPPADPSLLVRRLYFDLTGLPPTRAELHAYRDDDSPDAYQRLVDRLLASPRYGERWARHWMDVWRYSDWAGFGNEIRYSQKHIWRWRDWIVESLVADRGYDQMVREMLAADELAPGDEAAGRASGYLARNWYKFDRHTWLDETVEHSGRALLGMTLKCARCHDHKYDPISQEEYYRFRAIFEPYDVRTDQAPGQLDLERDGLVRVFDARPEAATHLFERGDPKRADTSRSLAPGTPAVIAGVAWSVEPLTLPLVATYPALRPSVTGDLISQAAAQVEAARRALAGEQSTLAEHRLATAEARLAAVQARVAAELAKHNQPLPAELSAGQPPETQDAAGLARAAAQAERQAALADAREKLAAAEQELAAVPGQANAPGPGQDKPAPADEAAQKQLAEIQARVEAARKALSAADQAAAADSSAYTPLGPTYPATSTGRRLALARWITDRHHPLTARVAVNHIWLRHFGQPLVESVDDFGLRAPRPPLADVLDYLAVELMEHDWSMKHIHRLIVTSSAYQLASHAGPASGQSEQRDRDNQYLWRRRPQRLEAEAIRDALLHLPANLDLALGGPDIDHQQGLTVARRSLYFRHARERQVELLQLFDAASPRECYRRQQSIRPQQALALIHSSLSLAQARRLAARLTADVDFQVAIRSANGDYVDYGEQADDPASRFVIGAFETILSRAPSAAELFECRQFLQQQAQLLADPAQLEPIGPAHDPVPPAADPAQRARENLVLVLLNHNDFLTVR